MIECKLCHSSTCRELVSFGKQPVCHRFALDNEPDNLFPLSLGQCEHCGLVQLVQPFPVEALTPKYAWVAQNEPMAHIEPMADCIADLVGIDTDSRILGLYEFDEPLLRALRSKGFKHVSLLDPFRDLGCLSQRKLGPELFQELIRPDVLNSFAQRSGGYDVVISRRVLEHAYDTSQFIDGLACLCKPNGYLVVEVPDCGRSFELGDVAAIWEEHLVYFSPQTFLSGLATKGLKLDRFDTYPYPLEDCLVATVKPGTEPITIDWGFVSEERARVDQFVRHVFDEKVKLQRYFEEYSQTQGKIVWMGAGHRSCTFINTMGIGEWIYCVIDDDTNKQGMQMPGSRLPIRGSDVLDDRHVTLCVLCINTNAEDRVIARNSKFITRGGKFVSVACGSTYQLVVG